MSKRSREEIWGPPSADHPDHAAYVRSRGCVVAAWTCCRGPLAAHHIRSRGAGGLAYDNLIGLCTQHHAEIHSGGRRAFGMMYSTIRIEEIAADLWLDHYGFLPEEDTE